MPTQSNKPEKNEIKGLSSAFTRANVKKLRSSVLWVSQTKPRVQTKLCILYFKGKMYQCWRESIPFQPKNIMWPIQHHGEGVSDLVLTTVNRTTLLITRRPPCEAGVVEPILVDGDYNCRTRLG